MASLTDAQETLCSTNAKANFQRLTRLLMCGGLRLLRETLDSILLPADLPSRLSDPTIQAQLRRARLNRKERACLYPSPGVYGKSTDCDITLVFRLLRTICNLPPPPRGWDDLPNSSDHSLEADLVRIKYYRNEVYGHSKTMEISDVEFLRLWGEISEALLRIAATISHAKRDEWKKSIDEFLADPLTPVEKRCIEELNRWYMNDMDVKAQVERFDTTFQEGIAVQGKLQEKVQGLREDVQQLTQTVRTVEQLIRISLDSVSQGGVPTSLSHSPGVADSNRTCVVPIPPEQPQQATGTESLLGAAFPGNRQNSPTEREILNVIKEYIYTFLKYLSDKLNVVVQGHTLGSLLITVECSSLQVLEGLWEDYHSGHLKKVAQEMLITPQVLERLGVTDVKLKTIISEEEYEKGKRIFTDNSEQSKVDSSAVQQNVILTDSSVTEESLTGKIEEDTALASSSKSAPSSQDYDLLTICNNWREQSMATAVGLSGGSAYGRLKKQNKEAIDSEFVEVPRDLKGHVIGRDGHFVKDIMKKSGTKISSGRDEEGFTISGHVDQRACAKSLILEKVQEILSRENDAPRAPFGELVQIPAIYKGLVMGKGGDNLRNISTQTGAKVIRKDGEVHITSGTKQQRQQAKVLIGSIISGARLRGVESEFNKVCRFIDGWNLPKNCELKLEKVQDHNVVPGSNVQYRLIPAEEYELQEISK